MSNENINKEEKVFDFESIFDVFITKGHVEEEKEIIPGFRIKLRPLDTDEQIAAESISIANNPYIPIDTLEKIRTINILSKAIIELNGVSIANSDDAKDIENQKRNKLYQKLMSLPTHVIDDIYKLYIEAVNKQRKIYTETTDEGKNIGEKVENF